MINEINSSLSFTFSQLNLDISTSAFTQQNSGWNCTDAVAPFSRIYFVTGGEGKIVYEKTVYKLTPGTICVLPSNVNFEYHCDNELEKLYFHVQLQYNGASDICTNIGRPVFFRDRFDTIAKIKELYFDSSMSLKSIYMLKSVIMDVIAEAFSVTETSIGNAVFYSQQILKAQEYIGDNLRANLTINEIANHLFMSPSQLQKRFKAEVGKPIGKYLRDRIMALAEQKLRTTGKTIRDISDELGFCDQFFFSRTFTDFYGISPRAYRNRINGQNQF